MQRQALQRERYNRKYRDEKDFQESECKRCAAGLRKRRGAKALEEQADAKMLAAPPIVDLQLLARGLVAQLLNSDDPSEISDAVRHYERRGQRVVDFPESMQGASRIKKI
jgi:hypothetical protein